MCDLYEKIAALCEAKGVNMSRMCRESGASRGTLTDLKMGRVKSLSADTLKKISEYFNVSVDHLLGNEQKPDADAELTEYLEYLKNRPEMRMLFSTLKGATKEDVEKAVRIIEALRSDANG